VQCGAGQPALPFFAQEHALLAPDRALFACRSLRRRYVYPSVSSVLAGQYRFTLTCVVTTLKSPWTTTFPRASWQLTRERLKTKARGHTIIRAVRSRLTRCSVRRHRAFARLLDGAYPRDQFEPSGYALVDPNAFRHLHLRILLGPLDDLADSLRVSRQGRDRHDRQDRSLQPAEKVPWCLPASPARAAEECRDV